MAGELYNWIREIVAATAGSALADAAVRSEVATSDQRAALLLEFQQLPEDAAGVMWRRHRAALDRLRENHFVLALAKIPPEKRPEALLRLAKMTDEDFEQALTLLNPELGRIGEAAARVDRSVKPVTEAVNDFNKKLEVLRDPARAWAEKPKKD